MLQKNKKITTKILDFSIFSHLKNDDDKKMIEKLIIFSILFYSIRFCDTSIEIK